MAGVYLPESNTVITPKIILNEDELGLKIIHDWIAMFASIGIELTYFVDNVSATKPDQVWLLKRKLLDPKPQAPSKTVTQQMDKLTDDIKKEVK